MRMCYDYRAAIEVHASEIEACYRVLGRRGACMATKCARGAGQIRFARRRARNCKSDW